MPVQTGHEIIPELVSQVRHRFAAQTGRPPGLLAVVARVCEDSRLGANTPPRLDATQLGLGRPGNVNPTRSLFTVRVGEARRSAVARKRWRDARAFQVDVQTLLARACVQFTEWLLLETLQELLDETGDAVGQAAIAERAGLTRKVASYWLIVMSENALVDRGPASEGTAWRVILTDFGEQTLRVCNERLEEAGLTG